MLEHIIVGLLVVNAVYTHWRIAVAGNVIEGPIVHIGDGPAVLNESGQLTVKGNIIAHPGPCDHRL